MGAPLLLSPVQSGLSYGYIIVMQDNSEHRPPEDSFSLVTTAAGVAAVTLVAAPVVYVGVAVLTVVWPMVPLIAVAAFCAGVANTGSSGQTDDRRKRR